MKLEGERCAVRPWRAADVEAIVRHANNPNVARQLRDRFPHPYRAEHARAFLRHAAAADPPTDFAIETDGEAVGGVGFVPGTDIERYSAEVGYWVGERYWGRGLATEALVLVTEHAFTRLNLLRMFALPFADNLASARVLEKAGYVREGVLRASSVKFGTPRDQVIYARVNERWEIPERS